MVSSLNCYNFVIIYSIPDFEIETECRISLFNPFIVIPKFISLIIQNSILC